MHALKRILKMESMKQYNTLFLDRDGVINKQRPDDYVKSPDEFVFIDGTLDALKCLSSHFRHIIIVTNQRGVGRGIMSNEDLERIHEYMINIIRSNGGRIDKIYTCTSINESCENRKPNIGMALQAKQDFPDIDFSLSLMAGDSLSDMEFANKANIPTILIGNKYQAEALTSVNIYQWYPDLLTFAEQINMDSDV